ncbi:MAG: hypothetical protein J6Y15_00360 [Bacteroidaceae bacterium]|nr:hypothetical protein [Bacteroidaceae bacterium]
MKALIYFLLFYSCIFLISMIPEDNVADNDTSVEVDRKSNKETSYTTHTDSLNKWVMSEMY